MEKQALNAVKKHLLKAVRGLAANPANGELAGRVARLSDAARASKLYGMDPPGMSRLADGTMVSARTGHALPNDPLARQFVLDSERGGIRELTSAADIAGGAGGIPLQEQMAMLEGRWTPQAVGLRSRIADVWDRMVRQPSASAFSRIAQKLVPGKFVARFGLNRRGKEVLPVGMRDIRRGRKLNVAGTDVELYTTRPGHVYGNKKVLDGGNASGDFLMPGAGARGRNVVALDRRPNVFDQDSWLQSNPQAVLEHELGHAISFSADPELRNRLARRLAVEVQRQHRLTGGRYGNQLMVERPRDMIGNWNGPGYVRDGRIYSGVLDGQNGRRATLRNEAQATYIPQVLRGRRSAISRLGSEFMADTRNIAGAGDRELAARVLGGENVDVGSIMASRLPVHLRLYGIGQASPEFRNVMTHLRSNYNYGEAIPYRPKETASGAVAAGNGIKILR